MDNIDEKFAGSEFQSGDLIATAVAYVDDYSGFEPETERTIVGNARYFKEGNDHNLVISLLGVEDRKLTHHFTIQYEPGMRYQPDDAFTEFKYTTNQTQDAIIDEAFPTVAEMAKLLELIEKKLSEHSPANLIATFREGDGDGDEISIEDIVKQFMAKADAAADQANVNESKSHPMSNLIDPKWKKLLTS